MFKDKVLAFLIKVLLWSLLVLFGFMVLLGSHAPLLALKYNAMSLGLGSGTPFE